MPIAILFVTRSVMSIPNDFDDILEYFNACHCPMSSMAFMEFLNQFISQCSQWHAWNFQGMSFPNVVNDMQMFSVRTVFVVCVVQHVYATQQKVTPQLHINHGREARLQRNQASERSKQDQKWRGAFSISV